MASGRNVLQIAQRFFEVAYIRPHFDTAYYLRVNSDVAASRIDPVRHYVLHGAGEGRNPVPGFNTNFYLTANPDVAASGRNPFCHYLRIGRKEGRAPAPSLPLLQSIHRAEISRPTKPEQAALTDLMPKRDWSQRKARCGLDVRAMRQHRIATQDAPLVVGDRRDADVEVPCSKGRSAKADARQAHLNRTGISGNRLWSSCEGDARPHWQGLLARALGNAAERHTGTEPLPVEAMAIPATGFALHILEQAVRRGVETVYFFSREGVCLKRLYEVLVAEDVLDLGRYPEARLLEVSRRATFAASLETFSISEMMRLWTQYSTQSLTALARTLNLDPADWAEAAAAQGIDLEEEIQHPWQDARVKAFLADPKVQSFTGARLETQRRALRQYLEAAGFAPGDAHDRLIVDIGWRGTIQDNIAHLCAGTVHGCYLGLSRFCNPQLANVSKTAFLMDRNIAEDSYEIGEFAALEVLFNALGGSVVGYRDGVALHEVIDSEEDMVGAWGLGAQDQICAATRAVAAYVRDHGLISDDLRPLARRIVTDYVTNPDRAVAEAFVGLEHDETFGTGASDNIAEPAKALAALSQKDGAAFHGGLQAQLGALRWVEAHRAAGPLRVLMDQLTPAQKLAVPLRLSAPALLPASALKGSRVCVYAPQPIKGSGGHRTIYNMSCRLSQAGYEVFLMNEAAGDRAAMIWQAEILAGSRVTLSNAWDAGLTPAAAVATIDYSALYLQDFFDSSDRVRGFYLVQDYEAQFNPVGDVYLRSQRSYAQGLNAITIGRWLSHMLRVQYGVGAASGGLGVDHATYRPLDFLPNGESRRGRRIAFLHQPEKFRRAPQLCMEALAEVKRRIPEVEVITYGSDTAPHLPFAAEHRGLIKDLNQINEIYNACQLGLCISATNPSRIPFEMMAAGCVPVDIYCYNNLFDYGAGSGVLAYQSPQSLAEAMCRLLEDDTLRGQRMQGGLNCVKHRTLDWETDVAVNTVSFVLEGGNLADLPHPEPSYTDAPILSQHCASGASEAYTAWQWRLATS